MDRYPIDGLIWWAPTPKAGKGRIFNKSAPAAPAAPNVTGAAQATAQGNIAAAAQAQAANMVNQVTPNGNLTYTATPNTQAYNDALNAWKQGGSVGSAPTQSMYQQWTANQSLSPQNQQILNQQQNLSSGLLDTAQNGLQYANGVMSKPGVDLNSINQLQSNVDQTGIQNQASQAAWDAQKATLDPQFQQQNDQLTQKLANQGINIGSDAYNNATQNQARTQNQAYQQARDSATAQGIAYQGQLYGQGLQNANLNNNVQGTQFQQQSYNQMQPINLINALRTGSQVQSPNFVNAPQQATTQGADLLGATNAQQQYNMGLYNSQVASANAGNSNTAAGAGTLAMLAMMSDPRTKENVVKVGNLYNGLPVYIFEYKPEFKDKAGHGTFMGVMADEVESLIPEAVITNSDGYKMVNYSLIG